MGQVRHGRKRIAQRRQVLEEADLEPGTRTRALAPRPLGRGEDQGVAEAPPEVDAEPEQAQDRNEHAGILTGESDVALLLATLDSPHGQSGDEGQPNRAGGCGHRPVRPESQGCP